MPLSLRRRLTMLAAVTLTLPLVALAPTSAQADPRTTDPAAASPRPADPEALVAVENGPEALRSAARAPETYQVLVFTKTAGARRASIQDGVATIRAAVRGGGYSTDPCLD